MAAVYPSPATVLAGVTYGPNGADYTGTFVAPTASQIAATILANPSVPLANGTTGNIGADLQTIKGELVTVTPFGVSFPPAIGTSTFLAGGSVTVNGYAAGQSPAAAIASTPAVLPTTPPTGYGVAPSAGAYPVTVTVTDGTNPIQGATVRATINGQTAATGSGGAAVLALDAGAYTLTTTAAGFGGQAQQVAVASGQQAAAVVLAADVVPTAPPGQVTGTLQVATSGAVATFQQRTDPTGLPCDPPPFTAAADGTLVTVTLAAGVRYAYSIGAAGVRRPFNTPGSGGFDIAAAAAAYLP